MANPDRSARSAAPTADRRTLGLEVLLVLGVSLGASAILSLVRITERLTREEALNEQIEALNESRLPTRPLFDLLDQVTRISLGLVPALLALYLLSRIPGGNPTRAVGLDLRRPRFDLAGAAALALIIGIPGLAVYLAALQLGVGVQIAPAALTAAWWTVPVLILSAAQTSLVEEVVGVGYLLERLRALGWHPAAMVAGHALLRGSYHLYQGLGGFLGNAAMGVVFALFYLRFRRVMPLVLAHLALDVVAFVGYALFKDELDALLETARSALPGR